MTDEQNLNDRSTQSHDHGEHRRGPKPPTVELSFLAGDYTKDKRATVRLRIISSSKKTLGQPVDLLAHQARELSRGLSDIASEVAATEGRR